MSHYYRSDRDDRSGYYPARSRDYRGQGPHLSGSYRSRRSPVGRHRVAPPPPSEWSRSPSPPPVKRRYVPPPPDNFRPRYPDRERKRYPLDEGPSRNGYHDGWRERGPQRYEENPPSKMRYPEERYDSDSRRPRRVAPPPPPDHEFSGGTKEELFDPDAEEGEVKDDEEEGECERSRSRRPRNYGGYFCAPVKCSMDDESMINFTRDNRLKESQSKEGSSSHERTLVLRPNEPERPPPSKDHPVIQELLQLQPKPKSPRPTPSSSSHNSAPSTTLQKPETSKVVEGPQSLDEIEEGEETREEITVESIKNKCEYMLIDKQFLTHLSEINPISALHEITQKLGWSLPNMKVAFECGPPTMKMFIYKAIVNGEEFQPAVAVDNKKDAKANAAWFALQEMGFVKPDAGNPL